MAENNMDLMAWLRKQLADVALPDRTAATWRGREFFGYPATWHSEDWAEGGYPFSSTDHNM